MVCASRFSIGAVRSRGREQTPAAALSAAAGRQKRHERHDAGAPQPNDACLFRSLHVIHPRSSRAPETPVRVQWPGI
jgi:hypothetical protein